MSCSFLRVGFCLVLAVLPALAGAQTAKPVFTISAFTADDAGGIYNGSPVNVSITVHNSSTFAGPYQGVLSIPANYAFVDATPCGGALLQPVICKSYPGSSNYLVWPSGTTGANLSAGASATCTVRLIATQTSSSDAAFAYAYDAPYGPCNGVAATGTGTYRFQTTSTPTTDAAIAISTSSGSVTVGGTVDYTLTASNHGRQDATNVQTQFTFPTSYSVAPKNCPGASTTGGNGFTWNLGTLAYGTSANCVLTATANSGGGGNATVNAKISLPSMTDSNPANDTASNTIPVAAGAVADLAASITADKLSPMTGDTVTFTLKASNAGPQDATQTQLTAVFPPPLDPISTTCFSGAPPNPLVWQAGTITAGASHSCTVAVKVSAGTQTSVSASANVSSAVPDSNSANNSASVLLSLQQGGTPQPNLAIHLSDPRAGHTYAPGETLNLTVTASNTTPALSATGVVANVHVRNQSDLSGLTATCGTFDSDGRLAWNIGTLVGGSSLVCNVSATVAGGSRVIPVTAHIRDPALGMDRSRLLDVLLVEVNPGPRRLSVTTDGTPTSGNSTHLVLSRDGKTALFQSGEPRLVANNAHAATEHVFRVGSDGVPVLESLDANGQQLPGNARRPALSADGSTLAFFYSTSGPTAAKDAITGAMWAGGAGLPKHQADVGPGGAAPNGPSVGTPSVAVAGGTHKMVFCSSASNLVAQDTNGANDVFLVDPTDATKPAQLVSTDSTGVQIPGDSCDPQLAADGNSVVFTVSSPTLYRTSARQIVRKDLVTGALDLISIAPVPGGPGANADSSEPSINGDGSMIAFTSKASDMDTLGAPAGGNEVFVWLPSGPNDAHTVRRVRSSDGTVPNGSSQHAQLNEDGSVLVMQTLATNFFGVGKSDSGNAGCGSVAVTMNFFTPAAMGSALCNGSTAHQDPTVSGDGTTVGFDSNAPQSGTTSSNSNVYMQPLSGVTSLGKAAFSSDYSGQWYDPDQSGHGLIIDVLPAGSNGSHLTSVIWFVYVNGQPSWLLGAGTPVAGSGSDAGKTVLDMQQVAIYHGVSFPIGETNATPSLWGSIRIVFADANTASMSWTSSFPGFNDGSMGLTHFLPVGTPATDPAGAQVKACYSGNWKEPSKSGHGFELEVLATDPPLLAADWFTYTPSGVPVWLQGAGPISGNGAQMQLQIIGGSGAQFPPLFDPTALTPQLWGTLGVTFSDANHAHVTWNSSLPGYGQGAIDIVPTYGLDRRGCE